jgi:hypothetical protein
MMIARWRIDARFGHKDEAIKLMKQWDVQFGSKIGWTADRLRLTTGSVGVAESAIVSEIQIKDLAELSEAFEKLAKLDGHAAWGKQLEPHVVSGTNNWEIFRVIQ